MFNKVYLNVVNDIETRRHKSGVQFEQIYLDFKSAYRRIYVTLFTCIFFTILIK